MDAHKIKVLTEKLSALKLDDQSFKVERFINGLGDDTTMLSISVWAARAEKYQVEPMRDVANRAAEIMIASGINLEPWSDYQESGYRGGYGILRSIGGCSFMLPFASIAIFSAFAQDYSQICYTIKFTMRDRKSVSEKDFY